jgi:hypothetical protein
LNHYNREKACLNFGQHVGTAANHCGPIHLRHASAHMNARSV